MNRKRKLIPVFKSEAEERDFWECHDSTDYVDWNTAEDTRFPNLEPSARGAAEVGGAVTGTCTEKETEPIGSSEQEK